MKKVSIFFTLAIVLVITGCSQKREIMVETPPVIKATKHTSKAWHKASMRSYKVANKRYRPRGVKVGDRMHGISSWYGPRFHGKRTSNGERYNMYARTAAHKTWPMDTLVKVTNRKNGKSTIVRINDRGPFVKGRIIDCSYRAGKEIGLDKMGIAKVDIEVIGCATKKSRKHKRKSKIKYSSNYGVQLGAFKQLKGAQNYKRLYTQNYKNYKPVIKQVSDTDGTPLYRVWLMGFNSQEEAKDFKISMQAMQHV